MRYAAIVIGGGPAGMAAACAVKESEKVLIIEREARLGGILKQCVHDGFGVIRFGEKLSGPEYADRFIEEVYARKNIDVKVLTFVTSIEKENGYYRVSTTSGAGIETHEGENLILANGCRERTARQVNIHGTRPAGLMTAGTAQNLVNLLGVNPAKRCVILGSGDIGLIMARRLTLEGSQVLGVYEAKSSPSGLQRNLQQCLYDFGIPLHLKKTVTLVHGRDRVEGVTVADVDDGMLPIAGTEEYIPCDALIVSVGLIPENELAEKLGVAMDAKTKGPIVDQYMMTTLDGVYSVGNALHVHDLVDYVSEVSETAGKDVGRRKERATIEVLSRGLGYIVPQRIDVKNLEEKTTYYFRTARETGKAKLTVTVNGVEIYSKKYSALRPPEAERVSIKHLLKAGDELKFVLEEDDGGKA